MLASDTRGLSLIESLMAMTIVSMMVLASMGVVSSQIRLTERSRHALEAEALASTRLDYMGLLTDAELQSLPDTVEKGKFDYPLDAYSWEAVSVPSSYQAGVYEIVLNINWPTNNVYSVHTFMYRRPLQRVVSQ